MTALTFNFHGVSVLVTGGPGELLEALRRDFEYFTVPGSPAPSSIRLELVARRPQAEQLRTGRLPLFRARDYTIFDKAGRRRIVYRDQAYAEYDFTTKAGSIHCADLERLHELAYLAILSRTGEELDLRGWHRVHALGFAHRGLGGLLLLPSGGGKSMLALELLRSTGMDLVSDETPLLTSDLRLMPFPLRIGLRPEVALPDVEERWIRTMRRRRFGVKRLVDLGFFRGRVNGGVPLSWLLVGKRRDGTVPHIRPISRLRAAEALAWSLVVGVGVAQMSEYMLRPEPRSLWNLSGIAFSRLRTACRVLRGLPCPRSFVLGADPRANMSVLAAFLAGA